MRERKKKRKKIQRLLDGVLDFLRPFLTAHHHPSGGPNLRGTLPPSEEKVPVRGLPERGRKVAKQWDLAGCYERIRPMRTTHSILVVVWFEMLAPDSSSFTWSSFSFFLFSSLLSAYRFPSKRGSETGVSKCLSGWWERYKNQSQKCGDSALAKLIPMPILAPLHFFPTAYPVPPLHGVYRIERPSTS